MQKKIFRNHIHPKTVFCLTFFTFLSTNCSSLPVVPPDHPLFTWPVSPKNRKITQKFKKGGKHEGIDLSGKINTKIQAVAPGEVIYAGQGFRGYGKLVIIEHGGDTWASFYAHLNQFKVRPGQKIKRGQTIGLMGKTGRSYGVHLHFEIRHNLKPVDPLPLLIP